METIYLLVMYWPNDKDMGKSVETHLGFWPDRDTAQEFADKLNGRKDVEEKYLVRSVRSANKNLIS